MFLFQGGYMARAINIEDTYRERMLKSVPSEVIGAYLAANGLLMSVPDPAAWAKWVLFLLCVILTPLWLIFFQEVKSVLQNVLSTVSFLVWGMTVPDGAFSTISGYHPVYGSVLIILFSGLIAPLLGKWIR
jgi:hypothetical protein